MSTETPTPETAKFMTLIDDSEIYLGMVEAKLSDFERDRDLAIKERDEAVQLFTQELNKAVERIKSHGTSPKSRT